MAKSSTACLTLYSREGCHLCQDMLHVLNDFSGDYNFTVNIIDIDADQTLRQRFNLLVPALYRGETEICHHFLDLEALATALAQSVDESHSESGNEVE